MSQPQPLSRRTGVSITAKRASATVLALSALVIGGWAIVRATREAFAVTGGAWSVFSLPHLLFHATHLDGMGGLDSVAEVASLALSLLLALALLPPQPRGGESP
jgi:hypothetical protein